MELNTYQFLASQTAIYPGKGTQKGLAYTALAVCGEVGEIAGKIAKQVRDGGELDVTDLSKELGDALWMVAGLATDLGLKMDNIAHENIRKLASRQERGVLKGSGDNR